MNLENLTTERRNENTMGLDEMSVKKLYKNESKTKSCNGSGSRISSH